MKDREYGAVARGIQEAVRFPASFERAGFRFAVADHTRDEQIRIIERGSEGVQQGVAEFSALVNGIGQMRAAMAGNSAGSGEFAKEAPDARSILGDFLVDGRIGPLQVGICVEGGPSVSRAGDIEHLSLLSVDQAIEMHVDEAESRGSSPMSEQTRLDVLFQERFAEKGILLKINLTDGEKIRRLPVAVHFVEQLRRKRPRDGGLRLFRWRLRYFYDGR